MSPPSMALFLPCRAGSERVPHKNTRPFAGHAGGLLGLKLDQLEAIPRDVVSVVVLDSNDPVVLDQGQARRQRWRGAIELIVRERPDVLGRSDTTTDALIAYALETVGCDHLAWTHVTSPLFDTAAYLRAFEAYAHRGDFDSLMTVTPLRGFIWDTRGPVNYRPLVSSDSSDIRRWPRTQDIAPLFEVNSALFVVPSDIGRQRGDRIGANPLLFATPAAQATDIDWPDDFTVAEALYRALGPIQSEETT